MRWKFRFKGLEEVGRTYWCMEHQPYTQEKLEKRMKSMKLPKNAKCSICGKKAVVMKIRKQYVYE